MKNEIVLFKTADGEFSMPVRFGEQSAWLTQSEISLLFGRDQSIISRHIKNAESDGEIDPETMYAKNAYLGENAAQKYEVTLYNSISARRITVSPMATSALPPDSFSTFPLAINSSPVATVRNALPIIRLSL